MNSVLEIESISKIPFRVVVENILVFFDLNIFEDSPPFLLFGYFKNEITRKIFQIFHSITINKSTNSIIEITKLKNLKLSGIDDDYFQILLRNSNKFDRLEYLHLSDEHRDSEHGYSLANICDWRNLFSVEGCFPKLIRLGISMKHETTEIDFNNILEFRNLHLLESLEFYIRKGELSLQPKNFLNETNWNLLEKLVLVSVVLPNETIITDLPNLEYLRMVGCCDVYIDVADPSPLIFLGFSITNFYDSFPIESRKKALSMLKKLFFTSKRLEKFNLMLHPDIVCDWVLEDCNNKEFLKRITLGGCTFSPKPSQSRNFCLPPSLECLVLRPGVLFPMYLLNVGNYTEMKSFFFISHVFPRRNVVFKLRYSSHVEEMEVRFSENFKEENFIIPNSWDNLENLAIEHHKLTIQRRPDYVGERKWPTMPKLRNLELVNSYSLDDSFFSNTEFERLETLSLNRVSNILGQGWNSSVAKNLKTLKLGNMRVFSTQEIFRLLEFPFLDYLHLSNVKILPYEERIEFPLLKTLNIKACVGIGDWFFQNNVFRSLENLGLLKIVVTPSFRGDERLELRGTGWNLPNLIRMKVMISVETQKLYSVCFNEDFWKNPPFTSSETIDRSCVKKSLSTSSTSSILQSFFDAYERVVDGNVDDERKFGFKEIIEEKTPHEAYLLAELNHGINESIQRYIGKLVANELSIPHELKDMDLIDLISENIILTFEGISGADDDLPLFTQNLFKCFIVSSDHVRISELFYFCKPNNFPSRLVLDLRKSGRKKYFVEYIGSIDAKSKLYHGRGHLYDRKKLVYSGDFVSGKKEGKGIEFSFVRGLGSDEITYQGLFRRGLRHGKGESFDYKQKNGEVVKGEWDMGVLDESSVIRFNCPVINYGKIKNNLLNSTVVGSGAFGIVYEVKSSLISKSCGVEVRKLIKGQTCAVKIMRVRNFSEREMLFNITRRGVGLIYSIQNPHILEIFGIIKGTLEVGYITNLCDKSVLDLLREGGEIDLRTKIRIMNETAKGLAAMHSKDVMHRDLKWANVLLDFDGTVKVTDFDTLKEDEVKWRLQSLVQSSNIGSPGHVAPEVKKGKKYSLSCDVFAFGLMIYSLLFEESFPYISQYQCSCGQKMETIINSDLDQHVSICGLRPALDPRKMRKYPTILTNLMVQCWNGNPWNRPSFQDILHRFEVLDNPSVVPISLQFPKLSHVSVPEQKIYATKPFRVSNISEWVESKFVGSKVMRLEHNILGTIVQDSDLEKVIKIEMNPILRVELDRVDEMLLDEFFGKDEDLRKCDGNCEELRMKVKGLEEEMIQFSEKFEEVLLKNGDLGKRKELLMLKKILDEKIGRFGKKRSEDDDVFLGKKKKEEEKEEEEEEVEGEDHEDEK